MVHITNSHNNVDSNIGLADRVILNNPASVLIQYGEPRSATTLQFITLCAIRCLLHGSKTKCFAASSKCNNVVDWPGSAKKREPTVCKTHKVRDAILAASHPDAILFATGHIKSNVSDSGGWPQVARRMTQDWRNLTSPKEFQADWRLSYVAVAEMLSSRNDMLLQDYSHMFGLSAERTSELSDFLQLWSKLRVCCGAQMSERYRARLIGPPKDVKVRPSFHGASLESDTCEKYDLNAIEQGLMKTNVFKKGRKIQMIRRLSESDGKLDGTYCSRAHDATVRLKLVFNDERYLEL